MLKVYLPRKNVFGNVIWEKKTEELLLQAMEFKRETGCFLSFFPEEDGFVFNTNSDTPKDWTFEEIGILLSNLQCAFSEEEIIVQSFKYLKA